MNLQEILKLTVDDFDTRHEEVWDAIEALSVDELQTLCNNDPWEDEGITDGLWGTLMEKKEIALTELFKAKFKGKERTLLKDVVLNDRDITWHYFRHLLWNEEE
jgi:hypothetical protein